MLRKAVLATTIIVVAAIATGMIFSNRNQSAGDQPIAFSHRVHAGENQISCLYCHSAAARSTFAGVPPVATCYECHRVVRLKNPEIAKVMMHWDKKQPIEWVRIYELPDYVYFSHKRHVRAGVSCQSCHGEIQTMERVTKASPLTMGWCLDCHEQCGAHRECNTCHK